MRQNEVTRVALLVLDDTNTLSFAAAVDPLRSANRQSGARLFDWRFVTPSDAPVHLTSGLSVPAAPIHRLTGTDLLLIVASFQLETQATPALSASLRRLAADGTRIAGIDGGPWVMARAGLLHGQEATTHWEDLDRFADAFPDTRVVNARFRASGPYLTCAGAAPAIEMMLHLIREAHGPALASRVAGTFIYDLAAPATRPQSRGARLNHNALTARAHAVMEATLDAPLSVNLLARRLGVSARVLQVQFHSRLKRTPQAHYLALRLAEAERLVRQTSLPLQDVAAATGFTSQSAFARAFRRAHGQSARSLRKTAS